MRIFGYEIIIRRVSDPLWGLRPGDVENKARCDIAQYDRDGVSRKIARIKAVRVLRPGTSLKDAKEWVESREFRQ